MGAPDGVPSSSPAPDGEPVLVARDRGVVTVTLNRPQTLNAVTSDLERRYVEALRDADADPGGPGHRRHRRGPRVLLGR